MTFTNRLEKIFPGFGQPIVNDTLFLAANQALTSGQNTITIPLSAGAYLPTISTGKCRIKVYSGAGTAAAVSDILATGTDGTNTVTFAEAAYHPNSAPAISTTALVEYLFDFMCDLNLTSITVKITLTGSSPTALADIQVAGTI